MKMLFIGNSHTAMFAEAIKLDAAFDHDVTFFAQAGKGPVGAEFDNATVRAVDPKLKHALRILGMPEEISLDAFDGIVLVGMTLSAFHTVPKTQNHRVLGWIPHDHPLRAPSRLPISEALLAEAAQDSLNQGQAMRYLRHLREFTDCPVVMMPQPLASAHILEHPKWRSFARIKQWGEGAFHQAFVHRIISESCANFGGVHVLRQPASTVEHGFLTSGEFRKGAKQLNIKHTQEADDVLHANADFGAIMLREIFQVLEKV